MVKTELWPRLKTFLFWTPQFSSQVTYVWSIIVIVFICDKEWTIRLLRTDVGIVLYKTPDNFFTKSMEGFFHFVWTLSCYEKNNSQWNNRIGSLL